MSIILTLYRYSKKYINITKEYENLLVNNKNQEYNMVVKRVLNDFAEVLTMGLQGIYEPDELFTKSFNIKNGNMIRKKLPIMKSLWTLL